MIPPRFIIRATITQMQQFISTTPSKNPLVATFDQRVAASKSVPDARREELRAQAEKIVASQVYPAWKRGIALLQPLVSKATDDAGLWRFKGGAEAYAFALRRYTTTSLTADQIHEVGLKRVAELEGKMDEVFRQLGRTSGSVKERMAQLRKEQAYPLTDEGRAQIMADANAALRDAEKRAAAQFDRTPKAPVEARPFPRFREANAAANYTQPAADGSRPGIVQIPLRAEYMTKVRVRTLMYHEGVPGHHFQIALEQENRAQPRFRRLRAFGGISALSEGWGLYAEHLAAESDWYKDDPTGLLGQLDDELFRARRLVVDTGIHAKHWTRQQAIDYGIEASEVERYVVNPGQACSYMIGQLKLLELRDKAKKTLGDKFNIREFHSAVLSAGTLPLDLLEKQVDAYLRAATVVASLPKGEQVVPVYHEPHHRQLFAYGMTRILEGQVPPGDTSWYHVHAEPVVYITLSASAQRTQVLGEDWGRGRGEGVAAAPAGGRGAAPAAAARGAAPNGGPPLLRATSTTSYYDQPITHRIQNAGDRLFRFMVVSNASPGDESAATPADDGFAGTPELNNRWFRAYRIKLAPGQATEMHRHSTEAVVVQISDGQAFATGPMTWDLGEQGRWAWFDAGKEHQIKNTGTVPFEAIEIEVRRPAAH
jgi:quercetin dioxygenase-like cupin family protein